MFTIPEASTSFVVIEQELLYTQFSTVAQLFPTKPLKKQSLSILETRLTFDDIVQFLMVPLFVVAKPLKKIMFDELLKVMLSFDVLISTF